MTQIFNIPSSCSLVDVLAKHLLQKYHSDLLSLTDVTIFLPNRRAVRELQNAFVRLNGTTATLLPQILPLGSFDEEGYFAAGSGMDLPEVITPEERLMIFIRLITARPDEFKVEHLSFAQAGYLAHELASLVDMVNNENLDFARLKNLVPEEYAAHWQNTLDFLKIVSEFYPQILAERGLMDVAEYNNLLLKKQNQIFLEKQPNHEIIIAGTTATFPAMKELVKTVSLLPHGSVWLSGLDKYLDDNSWDMIDETHPQYELKQLLDFLQVSRFDIPDIVSPAFIEREKLVSEIMRPAEATDKWRQIDKNNISPASLDNLKIITCHDSREEALVIASIMRHNLETPEKTTALITEDRNLARRVSNELLRWGIEADDSAGIPLAQTPQGIFLRLVAAVCEDDFAPLSLLSLYKHPFSCVGKNASFVRHNIREYEKNFLRQRDKRKYETPDFIKEQKDMFGKLSALMQQTEAEFKDLLSTHIQIAEKIATREDKIGADILWSGEAGEAAANLLSNLLAAADTLGRIPHGQYLELFESLLSGVMVRSKYGSHPRLRILGPIEARLCNFDSLIVSGLNEGTMPANASSGAWLSRPMKKDFGFPLPEKAIGVSAHDFCEMLCGKEVFLTRSERVQGTPTVKSRWLMRLETVVKAAGIDMSSTNSSPYLQWAREFDRSHNITPIIPPCPRPPVEARPRALWASDIERLIYDPYYVFASKILKLRKLEDIKLLPDAVDMGIIVHSILEQFYTAYPQQFPDNAAEIMLNMGNQAFDDNNVDDEIRVFWQPRLQKIIDWIVAEEKKTRFNTEYTVCETKGKISFESTAGTFTLGAKADRIDKLKDGSLSILDYKTGKAHKIKEMKDGYAPQLPIEGIIAEQGGFEGIAAAPVSRLCYWRLGKETIALEDKVPDVLESNFDKIKYLIKLFDNPQTGYITRPNPKHVLSYTDYKHLSRISEWEVNDNEE